MSYWYLFKIKLQWQLTTNLTMTLQLHPNLFMYLCLSTIHTVNKRCTYLQHEHGGKLQWNGRSPEIQDIVHRSNPDTSSPLPSSSAWQRDGRPRNLNPRPETTNLLYWAPAHSKQRACVDNRDTHVADQELWRMHSALCCSDRHGIELSRDDTQCIYNTYKTYLQHLYRSDQHETALSQDDMHCIYNTKYNYTSTHADSVSIIGRRTNIIEDHTHIYTSVNIYNGCTCISRATVTMGNYFYFECVHYRSFK